MAHTSLHDQLGATTVAKLLADADRTRSREFGIGYFEQPGGDPIIGLHYTCDFKAEEEWGVNDLRKAITGDNPRRFSMTKDGRHHFATFSDVNGLILSTREYEKGHQIKWGDDVSEYADSPYLVDREPDYVAHYRNWLDYRVNGLSFWIHRKTVAELREEARELSISPLPRRKDDLIEQINRAKAPKDAPATWPGWFQNGRQLVFRADDGPTADVLKALQKTAADGHLAIGNGSGPFASGLFIYDARDETQELQDQREAQFDWYDARMAELEPVAKDLEENFLGYYFLGDPKVIDTGDGRKVVRYWLNSHTTGHAYDGRQIFGWFTLEELKDRSFVDKHNESKKNKAS